MPSTDSYAALPSHSPRCICRPCRDARKRVEHASWRAYGPAVARVLSDETAEHIAMLLRHHWLQKDIARVTGLSEATISQAKVRGVTINEETAERILSVQPGQSRGAKRRAAR